MYYHEKIGDLDKYLQDIESRIDAEEEERILAQWRDFADGKGDYLKELIRREENPSSIEWPDIYMNEALTDEALMLYSVYKQCSKRLEKGSQMLMNVRASYGVGILPNTIAGVKFFMMDDEVNMLPNVYGIEGGGDRIEKFLAEPMPSVYAHVGEHVFSVGKKFMDIKERYPKIGKYILFDHPDCQGPMDVCELLWGSDIFFELYESPELVHAMLRKVTDFYKLFLDEWFRICPNDTGYHVPYGRMIRGKILVRDDSAVNLSPAFFDEFIKPYDEELLIHFGGGGLHFCGKGDHFIDKFKDIKGLYGVDLSQPHLNDMDKVLSNIVDEGINLCLVPKECMEQYKYSKYNMNRVANII
ncbi:MAG: uroporphyrinogen decarboxylase family protein [Lachnospiraceae bacterium]